MQQTLHRMSGLAHPLHNRMHTSCRCPCCYAHGFFIFIQLLLTVETGSSFCLILSVIICCHRYVKLRLAEQTQSHASWSHCDVTMQAVSSATLGGYEAYLRKSISACTRVTLDMLLYEPVKDGDDYCPPQDLHSHAHNHQ